MSTTAQVDILGDAGLVPDYEFAKIVDAYTIADR